MIFGRQETFAIEVSALGKGPSGDEPVAAATWTALKLFVRGKNLFRNLKQDDDRVSNAVNWPSVFLARWLVHSWGAVFHTPAWPTPATARNARDVAALLDGDLIDNDGDDDLLDTRDEFVQTHSLRAAAAGAAMPDIWLSRDGDVVCVAWSDSWEGDIYFPLARGEADVPAGDFADAVKGFVAWVRETLGEADIAEALADIAFFDEWLRAFDRPAGAHAALVSEVGLSEESLERVRQLAGVDTNAELFQLAPQWFESGTLADVRDSPIAVAFRCVAPVLTAEDLVRVRTTFLGAGYNLRSFEKLSALASSVTPPMREQHDHVRGYHLARGLRTRLGNTSEFLDVDDLVSTLGIPVVDLELSDPSVDGGCVCDNDHGPVIFTNPRSTRSATSWGKRVVLAHELCHLLFDREDARPIGILSGPWAPPRVERVANAFAIELLLPLAGIVATVGPAWHGTTDQQLEALMEKYGLGLTAVSEHVRNMRSRANR